MRTRNMRNWLMVLLLVGWLTSCETMKNVTYFKDVPDSARISVPTTGYTELTIQPDDIITVNIQTVDPSANAIFNQAPSSAISQISGGLGAAGLTSAIMNAGSPSTSASGYLVGKDGMIELPLLGQVKVAGSTTSIAADSIRNRAALLYKQPAVNVRFANLKINVLGEVLKPGTYVLTNEKNTIFDAIGLAGDLTIFGKRENVLLIRDSAGKSNFIRFSLESKDLVRKDFFYLRQNDVLYIEPNESKAKTLDTYRFRNYTIYAALLSVLIIVATRIK